MREVGLNGLALTRHCEGTVYSVYLDSSGYPSGGAGHLIRATDDVERDGLGRPIVGSPLSFDVVSAWLRHDLATAVAAVNACGDDFTQNQFDALTDFAFNAGGANLAELIGNAKKDGVSVADRFSHYTRSGDNHPRGLKVRRALERDLFVTPDEVPLAVGWLRAHDTEFQS